MRDATGAQKSCASAMRLTISVVAIAYAAYAAVPALATTLLRMSLQQLAASADTIVRGRCLGVESRWENGTIWTLAEIDVTESLKGTPPARIRLRSPGGRVGHIVSTVDSTPKLRLGQDGVFFLQKNSLGVYSVSAWAEGMFRVRRDLTG